MPIGDIPGLIWATDEPIISTETGDVTPLIPLARSGPFYMALSFDDTGLATEHERVIFSLNNVQFGYDIGIAYLTIVSGWGGVRLQIDSPSGIVNTALPTVVGGRQTWEVFASSADGVSIVTEHDGTFSIAGFDIAATDTLSLAHRPYWGSSSSRRDQTLYRARAYNRVPTTAERAEIVAHVASEGSTETVHQRSAAVAATSAITAARTVTRGRFAIVAAASALTAARNLFRSRAAAVLARAGVTASRTALHARGATMQAQSTATAARTVVHDRAAAISAISTVTGSTVNVTVRERSAAVGAISSATAVATRVVSRGAAVSGVSLATADRTLVRSRGAAVAGAAVLAAGRTAIHARAAAVRAVSAITVTVSGGPPVPVRFAYPGEVRAGRLIHDSRAGTLLGGPRTGTLMRG